MSKWILTAAAAVALSANAVAQPAPKAPAGCDKFFATLSAFAQASPGNRIHLVWTTNYFAHDTRFIGWSAIWLAAQGGDLSGIGQRQKTFFQGFGNGSEKASIRIRGDHQILLNEQDRPYRASCSGGRFAIIDSGDSIETFQFSVPPAITASGKKTCPNGMKLVGDACLMKE